MFCVGFILGLLWAYFCGVVFVFVVPDVVGLLWCEFGCVLDFGVFYCLSILVCGLEFVGSFVNGFCVLFGISWLWHCVRSACCGLF